MVESGSTLTGILVGHWSPNYISILKKYQQLTWQFAVRHPFGGDKRIYIQVTMTQQWQPLIKSHPEAHVDIKLWIDCVINLTPLCNVLSSAILLDVRFLQFSCACQILPDWNFQHSGRWYFKSSWAGAEPGRLFRILPYVNSYPPCLHMIRPFF